MKNKKYITLVIVLAAVGIFYISTASSGELDFCVWGLSCAEDNYLVSPVLYYPLDEVIPINEFENYSFTEEGVVNYSSTNNTSKNTKFFKALEKVINVSRRDYQEVIEVVSVGEDFDEIYHLNIKIFRENYTLLIDHSSSTGEYIQNIGEIVLNDYQGDCDDYALMLYLIAKEKGLDVRYVTGERIGAGHAWIQIKVDGEWVEYNSTSDTICSNCISELFVFLDYFEEEEDE